MEFFRDTQIDFMKYRKFFVVLSAVLLTVSVVTVFVRGDLNLGIDFAGGSQLTLKFQQEPEIDELRSLVADAGIEEALIQRFGDESANEVLIKTASMSGQEAVSVSGGEEAVSVSGGEGAVSVSGGEEAVSVSGEEATSASGEEKGTRSVIVAALDERYNTGSTKGLDLNHQGREALSELLFELDPDQVRAQDASTASQHYADVADAIHDIRRDAGGLLTGWDQVGAAAGVSPETFAALQSRADIGSFSVLGFENVGPQIGAELRLKGILAILASLVGMLVYIWFRFELRFGIGALVALTHDVLIVLGFFALGGFEFNLTTVAAFLTLVGYSVNDTVVVFDRVRENLRRARRESLVDTMNKSINQTLSRTVLTSGTTLMVVGSLFFLGGDVLRGFAFILTIGVFVGTYSSIYVASPFAVLWENLFGRQARTRRAEQRAQA